MILTFYASKIQGDLAGNIYDVDVSSVNEIATILAQ